MMVMSSFLNDVMTIGDIIILKMVTASNSHSPTNFINNGQQPATTTTSTPTHKNHTYLYYVVPVERELGPIHFTNELLMMVKTDIQL